MTMVQTHHRLTKATVYTSLLAIAIMVSGCGILQPRGGSELTPQQTAAIIKSSARTATVVSLNEAEEEVAERRALAEQIQDEVVDNIKPLLADSDAVLSDSLYNLVATKLEGEYRIYLLQALDILNIYFVTPQPGEVLSETQLLYLTSFIQGVEEGISLVLSEE